MSGLSTESTLVPLAVLLASLAGSAHCVAMCGGIITATASTPARSVAYHLGRLLSYAGLGALAGALGAGALQAPVLKSVAPWIVSVTVGLALISLGVRHIRGQALHLNLPARLAPRLTKAWGQAFARKDSLRGAASLGALSAFLPCGWLYSFVLAAAATQSIWLGAATTTVFWVGTLPALALAPWAARRILDRLRLRAPRLSGALLIGAGLTSLSLHMTPLLKEAPPQPPGQSQSSSEHSCH